MSEMKSIPVSELIGVALDWAAASCTGHPVYSMRENWPGNYAVTAEATQKPVIILDLVGRLWIESDGESLPWTPCSNWAQGGLLIEKFGVLLSPPASPVHRNFGYLDKRNGYYPSGSWGATIFAQDRKHRRRAFDHQTSPLIAAMRAIVQFELGDTVEVPAELISVLTSPSPSPAPGKEPA